jgi:hypothetical protein
MKSRHSSTPSMGDKGLVREGATHGRAVPVGIKRGRRPLLHGLEDVGPIGAPQNKFKNHQLISPSQSTSLPKATAANMMTPNVIDGSRFASIVIPIAATTSISVAACCNSHPALHLAAFSPAAAPAGVDSLGLNRRRRRRAPSASQCEQ